MCPDDHAYYLDQQGDRKMFSTKSVDPKWRKHFLRKLNRLDRKRSEAYADSSFQGDTSLDEVDLESQPDHVQEEFDPKNAETDSPSKKKKTL